MRATLDQAGFGGATVQNFGSSRDVLIRLPPKGGRGHRCRERQRLPGPEHGGRRARWSCGGWSSSGPRWARTWRSRAGSRSSTRSSGILIYVALRFEYRYAVGAVIATIHDVIVTVAVFSLFQIEFDLTVLAAVLAVIGYSLNDTIVIYDRIRENFRKVRKGTPEEIVNLSVNDTMSRTIITSGTTFITVLALYLFGGEVIHGFALALMVGIGVGTYSSIYVASAAALMLGISRADMMPVKKEGEALDGLP